MTVFSSLRRQPIKTLLALLLCLSICGCQLMAISLNKISENGVTVMNDSRYTLTVHINGSKFGSWLEPGEHVIVPVEMVFDNAPSRMDILAKAFHNGMYAGSAAYTVWIQHYWNKDRGYGNNLPQTIIVCDHNFRNH